jgi:hypothetical protein
MRKKVDMLTVNMKVRQHGNREDTEGVTDNRNSEHRKTAEAEYRLVTSIRKLTQ